MTTGRPAVSDAHIAAYARDLLESSKTLLNDDSVIPVRQACPSCDRVAEVLTLPTNTIGAPILAKMLYVVRRPYDLMRCPSQLLIYFTD